MAHDKDISAAASLLGRLGAKAGASKAGKASMASRTPAERKALARKAIRARWAAHKRNAKGRSK